MPTRSTIHRQRGILLIVGLLAGSAGLAACGTSGEGTSAPPPPPPAIEDDTGDLPVVDDTTTTTEADEEDDDGGVYPDDAEGVSSHELIDLCELFPLEMAQEIVPTLEAPATDPARPHNREDYWCSWENPTPAHPEDSNPFDRPLRAAGISGAAGGRYADRYTPPEADVVDLEVDGADYYFGYSSDGGLAMYVTVLSADQKRFTEFYFGGGENICTEPYSSEDCVVDPAWDNADVRAALVDNANEMAEVLQPLLDDYEP